MSTSLLSAADTCVDVEIAKHSSAHSLMAQTLLVLVAGSEACLLLQSVGKTRADEVDPTALGRIEHKVQFWSLERRLSHRITLCCFVMYGTGTGTVLYCAVLFLFCVVMPMSFNLHVNGMAA